MRIISSIRTAARVVVAVATACSQRAEPRPTPSQDQTTMKAFGPDALLLVIDTKRVLDAVRDGADLEGRQS